MLRVMSLHRNEILKYIVLPAILISPLAIHFYRQRRTIDGKDQSKTPSAKEIFQTRECRYRLDESTSTVLVLPDGRKLGYAQYGNRSDRAIIAFHGLPGSRLEWASWEDLCLEHQACIIAVDRPGIGWSSPQPGRKILDHAKDVELLAEHLGLKRYVVMGASGGGPYALACAYSMPPDKLKGVSVMCGLGPPDMSRRGMALPNYLGWTLAWRYAPWIPRWHFSRDPSSQLEMDDETRFDLVKQQFSPDKLHERDAPWATNEALRYDLLRVYLRSCREAYGQGFDGLTLDGHLLAKDWGFRLEDIRRDLPIQLWYGTCDDIVPPGHGKMSAARLGPKADLRLLEETHSSIILNHKVNILEDLLAAL